MAITPGELLKPLKNESIQVRALAVAYFLIKHRGVSAVTSSDIVDIFKNIRDRTAAASNISQALINSAGLGFVHNTGAKRGKAILWEVTDSGAADVETRLGIVAELHEFAREVVELTAVASALANQDIREYLQEGVNCLKVRAVRASIVFVWSGAIRLVQQKLMDTALIGKTITSLRAQGIKANINSIDDWSYVKDIQTLQTAKDVGLYNKTEHQTIGNALVLRNQCGHPSNFTPTLNKTKSYLEEINDLMFSRFAK